MCGRSEQHEREKRGFAGRSEQARTGANVRADSTSRRSLVRPQYRPSLTHAVSAPFLRARNGPVVSDARYSALQGRLVQPLGSLHHLVEGRGEEARLSRLVALRDAVRRETVKSARPRTAISVPCSSVSAIQDRPNRSASSCPNVRPTTLIAGLGSSGSSCRSSAQRSSSASGGTAFRQQEAPNQ
jgi:hypothetical protein